VGAAVVRVAPCVRGAQVKLYYEHPQTHPCVNNRTHLWRERAHILKQVGALDAAVAGEERGVEEAW